MSLIELFLLAVGLSMDAFAVAVCKGLSTQRLCPRHYLIVGAWFGGFQALMPTLGWLLGSTFAEHITRFDHWIAFVLLALIGGSRAMAKRATIPSRSEPCCCWQWRPVLMHWRSV